MIMPSKRTRMGKPVGPRVKILMLEMPKPTLMRIDRREAEQDQVALVQRLVKNELLASNNEAVNHLSSAVQAVDRLPSGAITEKQQLCSLSP